uniref:alpha-N-acetylgalactosaminide alpha-2,6-sialyltransferase n=1 Tax=Sphenodon punctatus TaxID=8508 RepID=A0A8D0HCH0_SPHPU
MIYLRGHTLCWTGLGVLTLGFLFHAGTRYGQTRLLGFSSRWRPRPLQDLRTWKPGASVNWVWEPATTRLPESTTKSEQERFLGDQYGQDNTYCNLSCPTGIRQKVAGTAFNSTFLKNIPVLQWAWHARTEEYERLQLYSGAHGWQEVSWPVLRDALTLLNASSNGCMFDTCPPVGGAACICCAVVGNGGILNDSQMGAEIDRHDYVFRVNGAITKGFERDVGSRTSFYVFSTNTLMNSLRSYARNGFRTLPQSPETRYIFLPDHDRDYLLLHAAITRSPVATGRDKGTRPEKLFGENLSAARFKLLHPDFIRYLRNRFLHSAILSTSWRRLYRPSTGAVMLLAALHTCDKVSAYGFITPDYQAYSDHYFDRKHKPVGFYTNHDMRLEITLWQRLAQSGLLSLYSRK